MWFKSRFTIPAVAALCFCSIGGSARACVDLGDQRAKLLPIDGAAFDQFGISVAISGTTTIVGAHLEDDNGTDAGSAYGFDTATGKQLFKLLPDDGEAADLFGASVAISGDTAIVGAYVDDDNGTNSGSAYLFDISDPKNPVQNAKLLADDGAAGDLFGFSVGISGATAMVGVFQDDDNGTDSGSAYLFDISDPEEPSPDRQAPGRRRCH